MAGQGKRYLGFKTSCRRSRRRSPPPIATAHVIARPRRAATTGFVLARAIARAERQGSTRSAAAAGSQSIVTVVAGQ